jgi:hypothetical protein
VGLQEEQLGRWRRTVRQHRKAGLGSSEPCRENPAEERPCTWRLQPSRRGADIVEMQDVVEFDSGDGLDGGGVGWFNCSGDDAMDDFRKLGPLGLI